MLQPVGRLRDSTYGCALLALEKLYETGILAALLRSVGHLGKATWIIDRWRGFCFCPVCRRAVIRIYGSKASAGDTQRMASVPIVAPMFFMQSGNMFLDEAALHKRAEAVTHTPIQLP
jgi:hypothetical protein